MTNDRAGSHRSIDGTGRVVRFEGVGVSYDAKESWALSDVDWTVRPGERWVVLGPNGSGKTTLVALTTGFLHPSVGELELLGGRLGHGVDWRVVRSRIGVVSAGFAKQLRPDLSALDIVMTAKHGALEPWWHEYTDDDRARARRLLEDASFGYVADRPFGVCSEGERQQIQLARTLMKPPELLVLDEPAAGLDLGARERLVSRLAALAASAVTPPLVLVTHHVEEIPPSFTHALLLRSGRVVASGGLFETLTSETVSETFDLDVSIVADGDRYACRFR